MRHLKCRKNFLSGAVISILAAGVLLVSQQAGAAVVWDMPTPYPEAEFHTKNIRQFSDDLARLSGGEMKIKIHSAQSLFKHPEIKRAVRTGQVPIGEMLMANLQNEDPLFAADVIPFLATSHKHARALWKVQRPYIEARLRKRGMRLLYAVPWPGQGFYLKSPIRNVGDMKGVRFRTYNAATARLAELMGAVPTIVEAVEIPQAFATGIVEAMVTSGATGVRAKAWDFVGNFYDLNAWLPKNMVVVNERAFRRLSDKQRSVLLESARLAEARGWKMSADVAGSSVRELAANGVEVHAPNSEIVQQLGALGRRIVDEWLASAGPDGRALLSEYNDSQRK